MESPSGVKRAPRTSPRRNVIRWNVTSGTSAVLRFARYQPPNAAPPIDTMYSSASSHGATPRFFSRAGIAVVRGREVVWARVAAVGARLGDEERSGGTGCAVVGARCAAVLSGTGG